MIQNHVLQFAAPMGSESASFGRDRSNQSARFDRSARSPRFVTQSHALGAPMASPASLIVAAAIAVAVYLVGRRLVD